MSSRALFLDRDGVLNVDTGYLFRPNEFIWIDGAPEAIARAKVAGWHVIVVTNQSGIARGYYTEADMNHLHAVMNEDLERQTGARIDRFYHCPYHPDAVSERWRHPNHPDRKPNPGMLRKAIDALDLYPASCLMVGDCQSDLRAADAAGVPGILFEGGSLDELVRPLLGAPV